MSGPTFSSVMYDAATECALLRQKRKCTRTFGSKGCQGCNLYVGRYVKADQVQLDAFMLPASARASSIRRVGRFQNIVIAVIVLFVAYTCGNHQYHKHRQHQEYLERQQPTARPVAPMNNLSHVEKTLNKVAADLNKRTDVNKDGKINCIDAAVLFYKHYPNKNDVCIMLNYNPATGMNHLFNVVRRADGTWAGVEPQAHHTGHSVYSMHGVWGTQYDPSKNVDITSDYLKYVK